MTTKSDSAIRLVREELIQTNPTSQAVQPEPAVQPEMILPQMPQSPSEAAAVRASIAKPEKPEAATSLPVAATPTTEAKNLRATWHLFQAMLGVMLTISMILASRAALFAAIGIAGLLSWKAMENPTWMSLSVSSGFSLLVVVPCVVLYWRRG